MTAASIIYKLRYGHNYFEKFYPVMDILDNLNIPYSISQGGNYLILNGMTLVMSDDRKVIFVMDTKKPSTLLTLEEFKIYMDNLCTANT